MTSSMKIIRRDSRRPFVSVFDSSNAPHHRLRMSQFVGSRSFSGKSMLIQNKYIVYEFPQQACAPDFVPQDCSHARRLGRCPRRPIERDCRKMALSSYACAGKAEGRAESVGISSFQQSERGAIPTLILTIRPNPRPRRLAHIRSARLSIRGRHDARRREIRSRQGIGRIPRNLATGAHSARARGGNGATQPVRSGTKASRCRFWAASGRRALPATGSARGNWRAACGRD